MSAAAFLTGAPATADRRRKPAVRSVAEQNALAVKYQYLPKYTVAKLARRHVGIRRMDFDDACAEAAVALLNAARLWEPAKGAFTTYAVRSIYAHLLRMSAEDCLIHIPAHVYWRAGRNQERHRAQAEQVRNIERLGDREEWVPEREPGVRETTARWRQQYDELRERLDEEKRYVLDRRLAGATLADIGRELHRCREWIRQLERMAIRELRAAASEGG